MCTTLHTDFKKPVKFKDFPLFVSALDDGENIQGIYHIPITNEIAQANPDKYVYEECYQKYPIQLAWFNKKCGWDYYVFNGKHETSEELSSGITYMDADYIPNWADRGDDIESVLVKSGFLPDADGMTAKERFIALNEIRRSIKVFEIRGEARIPVIVQESSFPKYRVDDKFFELSFTIQYAPLLIQKQ